MKHVGEQVKPDTWYLPSRHTWQYPIVRRDRAQLLTRSKRFQLPAIGGPPCFPGGTLDNRPLQSKHENCIEYMGKCNLSKANAAVEHFGDGSSTFYLSWRSNSSTILDLGESGHDLVQCCVHICMKRAWGIFFDCLFHFT